MIKILVVEDEQRVAELLKRGLEESGYQVELAYDGVWGLRLFRAGEFQMVISDVILPKMSGFELCKEIRNINNRVPVLMLTALGTTDDKLDGFDAGADDYMVKPFDFRELDARIKVLLKRRLPVYPKHNLRNSSMRTCASTGRQKPSIGRRGRSNSLPKSTTCCFIWPRTPNGYLPVLK